MIRVYWLNKRGGKWTQSYVDYNDVESAKSGIHSDTPVKQFETAIKIHPDNSYQFFQNRELNELFPEIYKENSY